MKLLLFQALRLSKTVLGNNPPGKIVNLMSHETCKLDYNLRFFFHMWSAPITVSIVVYFVYLKSSYAGFIGIAVIFLLTPIQGKCICTLVIRRSCFNLCLNCL